MERILYHIGRRKGYGTLISEIEPNKWYRFDVEYRRRNGRYRMIVCIDGEQVKVLNEYFNNGDESRPPVRDIKHASFYVYVNAVATLHVDDIKIESE